MANDIYGGEGIGKNPDRLPALGIVVHRFVFPVAETFFRNLNRGRPGESVSYVRGVDFCSSCKSAGSDFVDVGLNRIVPTHFPETCL